MVGGTLLFIILFLVMALNAQQIIVNWWLSRWSAESGSTQGQDVLYYIRIYFALSMGTCLLILSYQLVSAYGGLRAAAQLHERMLTSLLGCPLSFFDTTPSGRLLNLFTADMKSIDVTLITELNGALSILFMMLAVVMMIS